MHWRILKSQLKVIENKAVNLLIIRIYKKIHLAIILSLIITFFSQNPKQSRRVMKVTQQLLFRDVELFKPMH
jgi:hypothetical protein